MKIAIYSLQTLCQQNESNFIIKSVHDKYIVLNIYIPKHILK